MRSNYWSCSKFADWLRGTDKPYAADVMGWRNWKLEAKSKHPIRYWLADEALDEIQNFVNWPADQLYALKYWFNNRFITKTHALTSNLERGKWHEFDQRLLHSMFDELVNFVEIEQAWWNIAWDDEARDRYQSPFYARGWFRWRTWRCPEAGINALQWASKLTDEEFREDKENAEPTPQAIAAKETLELYHWWKNVRPNRPDSHDASGWTAYCKRRTSKGYDIMESDLIEEEANERRTALDLCVKIEEDYHKEDEEMMIRLIRIRKSLWT